MLDSLVDPEEALPPEVAAWLDRAAATPPGPESPDDSFSYSAWMASLGRQEPMAEATAGVASGKIWQQPTRAALTPTRPFRASQPPHPTAAHTPVRRYTNTHHQTCAAASSAASSSAASPERAASFASAKSDDAAPPICPMEPTAPTANPPTSAQLVLDEMEESRRALTLERERSRVLTQELSSVSRQLEYASAALVREREQCEKLNASLGEARAAEQAVRAELRDELAKTRRDGHTLRHQYQREEDLLAQMAAMQRQRDAAISQVRDLRVEAQVMEKRLREQEVMNEQARLTLAFVSLPCVWLLSPSLVTHPIFCRTPFRLPPHPPLITAPC